MDEEETQEDISLVVMRSITTFEIVVGMLILILLVAIIWCNCGFEFQDGQTMRDFVRGGK